MKQDQTRGGGGGEKLSMKSLLLSCLLLKQKKNLMWGGSSSDAEVAKVKLLVIHHKAPGNGIKGRPMKIVAMLQPATTLPALETLFFTQHLHTPVNLHEVV
jgi:hypothetical protein